MSIEDYVKSEQVNKFEKDTDIFKIRKKDLEVVNKKIKNLS